MNRKSNDRLTLISQYFYPEMISTGHILTELLVELSLKGITTSTICAQPSYYTREKVEPLLRYRGINIVRTRNTQFNKNTMKGKLLNSLSFFVMAIGLALKEKEEAPVLLVTNPPFLGLVGPILRLVRRRPFLIVVHDLYPEIAVNMGFLKKNSLLAKIWKVLNGFVFNQSSYVIVLGRDVQNNIRNQLAMKDRNKVVYITNWADPYLIQPVDIKNNPDIDEIGLEGKFIVQYSGNMGLTHDMETIIEAARELKDLERVHFLMIGGGGKLKAIRGTATTYGLKNMTFLPYQPREKLRNSLGASHVGLIALENGAKGLSVPSKLYGIMASGRPAIAIVPPESEVAMTLREFNCGIVTPPKDVSALVKAVRWLMDHEQESKDMGERGYKAFLDNFTVARCAERYMELIKKAAQ
jgi:glycosyltransferase involved in cell wall biosynthesis